MRAAVLALLLTVAPAAAQDCFLGCDADLTGPAAAERFEAWLGRDLPDGAEVVGLYEGGFQDAFIQVRLSAGAAALPDLLAALHVKEADLAKDHGLDLGPERPAWWDMAGLAGLRAAEGQVPGMAHAAVAVAPEPGEPALWRVYVWAFQV